MAKAAKVTKSAPAAPTAKVVAPVVDKATAKAAAERTAENDVFTVGEGPSEGAKKLAPQAQQIVNLVEAAGKKGVTRKALVESMDGVVTTKQSLGRILSYYQKPLIDGGYLALEKAAVVAEEGDEEGDEENEE